MIQFVFAGLLASFLAYLSQFDKKNYALILAMLVIWYIAAFQDCIGVDFISYKQEFEKIVNGRTSGSFFRTDRDDIEIGWFLLCKGIGSVFGTFYAVTCVSYAVMLYPVYKILMYVTPKFRWISVFFYYFSIKQFLFVMSGQRQGMAIAFFVLMILAIKNQKYIKAVIFALLGISLHNSFLYILAFVPLVFIPYDRIDFYKYKYFIITACIVLFFVGFFYVSQFIESIQAMTALLEDAENGDVYIGYLNEMETNQRSLTNFISGLLLLLFYVIGLCCGKRYTPYCYLFYVLFILSYILSASVGDFGSFPRMFSYIGFFAIPSIANTTHRLNGILRYMFVAYLIFIVMYSFVSAVHTAQYESYLSYHTIFF